MYLFRSYDPVRDAERYMEAMDLLLERLPKCHCCGQHIQDDEALHYRTNEFEIWMCLGCIEDNTVLIEVD